MVRAGTPAVLAASSAILAALGLLSSGATGWWALAVALAAWTGLLGLLAAAVLLARDRRVLAGTLPRIGFPLVALGVLTAATGVGVGLAGEANPTPCDDTGTCIPPGSEEIGLLLTGGGVLLLAGAAVLLAGLARKHPVR